MQVTNSDKQVKKLGLSFQNAKQLQTWAELLPKGPEWKCKPWTTNFPTKTKVSLYYCDALECLQSLLQNPLMKDHLHLTPMQISTMAAKTMHIYMEWQSGDVAWSMQVQSLFYQCAKCVTFANISLGTITCQGDTAWHCAFLGQNQHLCDDRWLSSSPLTIKPHRSWHEFLDEAVQLHLPPNHASPYPKVYTQGPKNPWSVGRPPHTWMSRFYPQTTQNCCLN